MKKQAIRLLSVAMSLVLILCSLSLSAFAANSHDGDYLSDTVSTEETVLPQGSLLQRITQFFKGILNFLKELLNSLFNPSDNVTVTYVSDTGETIYKDEVEPNSALEIYFEPELARTGYSFNWVESSTGEIAYANMPVAEDIVLTADYTQTEYDTQTANYVVFQLLHNEDIYKELYGDTDDEFILGKIEEYGGYYLAVQGLDTTNANYPEEPVNLVIPASVTFTLPEDYTAGDEVSITNSQGTVYTTELSGELTGGSTYTLPVLRVAANALEDHTDVIKALVLPDSIVRIGNAVIHGSNTLEKVVLSYGIKKIGNAAFAENSALTTIELAASTTVLGTAAFRNCTSLESMTFPDGMTEINNSSFEGCTKLNNVILPEGVKTLGKKAFMNCTSLSDISLPDGLTSIGATAFYGCSALEQISIPATVISIGDGAFNRCSALKSVVLPEGLEQINAKLFKYCSALESVSIPAGVSAIGEEAFFKCSALSTVSYAGSAEQWNAIEVAAYNDALESAQKSFAA